MRKSLTLKRAFVLLIGYCLGAALMNGAISSWLRAWLPGTDVRWPYLIVMPVTIAVVLVVADRWIMLNFLLAPLIGVAIGFLSSIAVTECARFFALGSESYVHSWRAFEHQCAICNLALPGMILGGWLIGGLLALMRYFLGSSTVSKVRGRADE